jgi:hypothetical protein
MPTCSSLYMERWLYNGTAQWRQVEYNSASACFDRPLQRLVRRKGLSSDSRCLGRDAFTDRPPHHVVPMPQLRSANGRDRSSSPAALNLTPTCFNRGAMPPPLLLNLGVALTDLALTHLLRRITAGASPDGYGVCYTTNSVYRRSVCTRLLDIEQRCSICIATKIWSISISY